MIWDVFLKVVECCLATFAILGLIAIFAYVVDEWLK